jgi:DNA polymerase-3 subunit delta
MIHLFLNCDEFLASQQIGAIKRQFVEQALAPYSAGGRVPSADERAAALAGAAANTVEMDGSTVRGPDILAAAMTVSLFAEPRLIIVRGYLATLRERIARSKDETSAAWLEYTSFVNALGDLPAETGLILYDQLPARRSARGKGQGDGSEEDQGAPGGKALEMDIKLLTRLPAEVLTQYNLPTPRAGGRDAALEGWIEQHASTKGMRLQGPIVHMLTDRIGADLRRIDNELEKLSLYAGDRPITDADVRLMVADLGDEAIWGLTDGLSERNSAKAFRTLAELWADDKTPFMVMGSIAANYRLILRVKAAQEAGMRSAGEIAKAIGSRSEYPVTKAMRVTGRYSNRELENVMERMLDANQAMVTGAEPELEIELLVADLTLRHVRVQ